MSLAILFALIRLASAGSPTSCSNTQLSCHNTTTVEDLCCFVAPGGQLVQTQFWDASPSTGPSESWTIHGLWPDHCDGTYNSNCDSKRAYTNIGNILTTFGKSAVLDYMNTYWVDINGDDETFWEHEWGKHGTCISTLNPSCYTGYQTGEEAADFFEIAVNLFKTLPSYTWLANAGIIPSSTAAYTSSAILDALSNPRGHAPVIRCSNGALNEIWYHFDVIGSLQGNQFVAADPVGTTSNCPSTGIKYLPKSGASGSSSSVSSTQSPTSSSPSPPSSTPSGGAVSGSGYLNVIYNGAKDGCLISSGAWYTSGICATYTATPSGSGFTLSSSKGKCAVANDQFTCASSVSAATVFIASNGMLANGGSTTWYASAAASGQTQQSVFSTSHTVSFSIQWQAQ